MKTDKWFEWHDSPKIVIGVRYLDDRKKTGWQPVEVKHLYPMNGQLIASIAIPNKFINNP